MLYTVYADFRSSLASKLATSPLTDLSPCPTGFVTHLALGEASWTTSHVYTVGLGQVDTRHCVAQGSFSSGLRHPGSGSLVDSSTCTRTLH